MNLCFSTRGPRFIKFMAVISFTLYPAYISSVVIVGFLFNKSNYNKGSGTTVVFSNGVVKLSEISVGDLIIGER